MPLALKSREISASLYSRASACGERIARWVTRVSVSAESSTRLTQGWSERSSQPPSSMVLAAAKPARKEAAPIEAPGSAHGFSSAGSIT